MGNVQKKNCTTLLRITRAVFWKLCATYATHRSVTRNCWGRSSLWLYRVKKSYQNMGKWVPNVTIFYSCRPQFSTRVSCRKLGSPFSMELSGVLIKLSRSLGPPRIAGSWGGSYATNCYVYITFNPFSPILFLIVAKMSLPKRSAPHWSNLPF